MKTKKDLKKILSVVTIFGMCVSNVSAIHTFAAESYKWEIPPQFNDVWVFSDGLAAVMIEDRKWGYIDTTGELVIPYQFYAVGEFSEGLAPVRNNNSEWGYIDKTGKLVIPYQFFEAGKFSDGLASVGFFVDGHAKGAYIDSTGEFVIKDKGGETFSEGLAVVKNKNSEFGYINTAGELVIPYQFRVSGRFSDGLSMVCLGERTEEGSSVGYIDKTGEFVIFYDRSDIYLDEFSEGLAYVSEFETEERGYIDTTGKLVIPYEVIGSLADEIRYGGQFNNGLAYIVDGNDNVGYIDTTGKLVIPFDSAAVGQFGDGLAPAEGDNGKYGFVSSPYATVQPTTTKSTVLFKGLPLNVQGDVLVLNNRSYYPFRDLLNSVGASVEWDNATKTATGKLNGNTVSFVVDKDEYTVNGKTIKMDDAKLLVSNGKTYIPIRYALEGLGFTVEWDNATSSITVD